MGATIVSISRIAKASFSVCFEGQSCKIKDSYDKVIGIIPASDNGLYKVDRVYSAVTAPEHVELATMHRRLGHIALDAIWTLFRSSAAEGVQLIDDGAPLICDLCEHAKSTWKIIRREREETLVPSFSAEVHTDLWGPSPVVSLGGQKYYITFMDDHTRFTQLQILHTKDRALDAYKAFAAWASTQHGAQIKCLRSDRSGEYTGAEFTKFLNEQGTEWQLTMHDMPQHNGVAESLNRRLVERVRALLHQSELPKSLWGEAIHFCVWLKNRTSTQAIGRATTPFEQLTGCKPNLAGVPEWGQRVWVHRGSETKLDARASVTWWVGFNQDSLHAHRIYWPEKGSISVERNVKFASEQAVVYAPRFPILQAESTKLPPRSKEFGDI